MIPLVVRARSEAIRQRIAEIEKLDKEAQESLSFYQRQIDMRAEEWISLKLELDHIIFVAEAYDAQAREGSQTTLKGRVLAEFQAATHPLHPSDLTATLGESFHAVAAALGSLSRGNKIRRVNGKAWELS